MRKENLCSEPGCLNAYCAKGLCRKHYQHQRYLAHPEEKERSKIKMRAVPREVMRDRALQYAYGVDAAWYDAQFTKQNGVCAICHKPENKTINGVILRLAVDHCHDTLKVRGLLCQACNRGIGCFNHDPAVLTSAIEYLDKS